MSPTANRALLTLATVPLCWVAMTAVHELGHCVGLWATGGAVERVVLHPLAISRTDAAANPRPLPTVWAGPVLGVALPLFVWGVTAAARLPGAFVARFVAGFCCVANGCYIGAGVAAPVGDAKQMPRLGSPAWTLGLFGAACTLVGFALWNRQGGRFGWGDAPEEVTPAVAWTTAGVAAAGAFG